MPSSTMRNDMLKSAVRVRRTLTYRFQFFFVGISRRHQAQCTTICILSLPQKPSVCKLLLVKIAFNTPIVLRQE